MTTTAEMRREKNYTSCIEYAKDFAYGHWRRNTSSMDQSYSGMISMRTSMDQIALMGEPGTNMHTSMELLSMLLGRIRIQGELLATESETK